MDRPEDIDLADTATAPGDGPAVSHEDPSLGDQLSRGSSLGRYIIVDTIGVGGIGIVYSAFDPDLDRKVALKLLRKSHGTAARARLLREAQAMAKLSHPNVVTVYEVGTDGARDFVAMEYVDGQNLADWSSDSHEPDEVIRVYRQAGEGLAAAHVAGLVHRDFKPQNVLIDKSGRVLVTDFGLARHEAFEDGEQSTSRKASAQASLTATGAIMGTPAYMAPEQHLAKVADARSDQFSFCVALHEALCGERPFRGDRYDELRRAVTEGQPEPLPDSVSISARVRDALSKGMSRDPARRHASMEDLLLALAPAPRRSAPLALVAGLLLVLTVLAILRFAADDPAKSCQFDRSMLAGAWDETIRSRVATAFQKTGVEGSEEVFERLAIILDRYGDDIVAERISVCESSRGREAASDELVVLRMSCLQRRRRDLAALTTAFSRVDPSGVDRVIEAAGSLPQVSDCQDVKTLERGVAPPPADLREEVAVLQSRLEEARLESEAGHLKTAIEWVESVNARSLELGYLPLVAESFEALGRLYRREVRLKEAERAYEESILAAEESGYTEYRARALVGMTQLVADGSSRFGEARRLARRANAAIAQGGGDAELSVDIALALASIHTQEGDSKESLRLLEASLRDYREQPQTKATYVAKLQNSIAGIRIERGEYEEAHALARSSYEQIREELGDSHPRTVAYLGTLNLTHRLRGELDESRAIGAKLRAYWRSEKANSLLRDDEEYSEAHRSVQGHIVGPKGEPVAGATVVCAERIVADGRYIDAVWSAGRDALEHYSRDTTDDTGNFHCEQASTDEILVVAEHPQVGRSQFKRVASSEESVTNLEVELVPTGFLSGRVTKDGRPGRPQAVQAVPAGQDPILATHAVVTFLRSDGTYSFDRLAPGRYKVFTGPRTSTSSQFVKSKDVEVMPGRGAVLDFDQSEGDAALAVRVVGEGGAVLPSAQVLVVPESIDPQTAKEFNETIVSRGLDVRSHFWAEGEALRIADLRAGSQSLCVLPLGGDYRDPEYMQSITPESLGRISVHCQPVVLASGETLEVTVRVPAMQNDITLEPSSGPDE